MEHSESIETALDEALDALVAGDPEAVRRVRDRFGDAPELDQLVTAAGEMRGAFAAGGPSPDAQARHLRMIQEAAAQQAGRARSGLRSRPRAIRRFVLRPVVAVCLLLVMAAPGALALSARALPGEALYPAKIALENARLAVARDPAKDVGLHVEFAQRRLDEIARLSDRGLPARASLEPVLADLREHQRRATTGVLALRREGRSVGPLQERVAVSLQHSRERLTAIGTTSGCGAPGADGSCAVITAAVGIAEQALRRVDEGAVGEAPPAPADGGQPVPQPGEPAPPAPGGEEPGGAPEPPAAGVPEPGGGSGEAQPGTGGGQAPAPPDTPPNPEPAPPAPGQPAPGGAPAPPAAAEPVQVEIDIKPLDASNTIDVIRRRDLPVVVRSAPGFDATTLDLSSVCFGDDPTDPANSDCTPEGSRLRDVDRDGDQDLLIVFQPQESGIDAGDTEACLSGRTTDGRAVKGCDKVSVLDTGLRPRAVGRYGRGAGPAALPAEPSRAIPDR